MSKVAVAVLERPPDVSMGDPGLCALRGKLAGAGAGAREEVMVDFLEDDLRAAEDAVDQLRAHVRAIGAALRSGRVARAEILGLARSEQPMDRIDELQETMTGLRRRLAVIAARLPR